MNSTYRIVWNALRQLWIAVPETAHAHRKAGRASSTVRSTTRRPGLSPRLATLAAATLAAIGLLGTESALATPCIRDKAGSNILITGDCNNTDIAVRVTTADNGYLITIDPNARVLPITMTDIGDARNPPDDLPAVFASSILPLFTINGNLTGHDFDIDAYRQTNGTNTDDNQSDTGTLDLQSIRAIVNSNIDPIYTEVQDGVKVYRPLTLNMSVVRLNGNILPTHEQTSRTYYAEPMMGVRYPSIRLNALNTLIVRGTVHGINATQLDGGEGIFVAGSSNYVDIASEVLGGNSANATGGSAVVFTQSDETLVLRAGAKLKAGSGGTPFTVKMGTSNTLQLNADLGTGAAKVDINGQVQGTNTTLALGGEEGSEYTLSASNFAEGAALETAGITTLNKVGFGTWKFQGDLPSSITEINVEGGVLDLRGMHATSDNSYIVMVGDNHGTSQIRYLDEETLAYHNTETHGTLFLSGQQYLTSLTVNRGATVNIAGDTVFTDAVEEGNILFQDGSTLVTDATTLGQGNGNDVWKAAFLKALTDRTLVTTNYINVNDERWNRIPLWKVEAGAGVKDTANMPTTTEVKDGSYISFTQGLNLKTFESTQEKTLKNPNGTTWLYGTNNLDWFEEHDATPIRSTFGTMKFARGAKLETAVNTGTDLANILSQLDDSTFGGATLITTDNFVGQDQMVDFGTWRVKGATNTSTALAKKTIIESTATLDTTATQLSADQTVQVDGTLAFKQLTLNGAITGAGTLRKYGASPLIVAGTDKTFSGTFDIAAGTVNMQSVNWTALSNVRVQDRATLQLYASDLSGAALTVDRGGKLDVMASDATSPSDGGSSSNGAGSGSSSSSPSSNSVTPDTTLENTAVQPMAARVRVPRALAESNSSSTESEPPSYEGTTADRTHVANATINGTFVVHADSTDHFTQLWSTGDIIIGEGATLDIQPRTWTSSAILKNVLKSDTRLSGQFSGNGFSNDALHLSIVPSYRTADHAMDLKVVYTGTVTPPEGNCSETHPCPPGSDGGNPNENNPNGGNPDGNNPNGNNPDGNNPNGNNPDGNNPNGNNPGDNTNPPGNTNRHTLETIAREYGKDAAVPMARVMDELITKNPAASIDLGLLALNDRARLAEAMVQAMPLLSGTGNRALMDAMREMTRPAAVDRCQAPTDKHVWAEALGDWSRRNSAGGAMGYDANHTGIAVGSDACIERLKNTRLGFTGAYTHTDADSRGTSSDHNLKANSWMVGLYGNTPLNDAWDVDFNVNAGRSSVKGTRNLTLANRVAKSKTDATLVTAGAGLNWHLMVTDKMTVTPFVRADYSRVAMDGYTETGAKGLNLSVEKQTSDSFVTRVGVKTELAVTPAWSVSATAAVGADWMDKGHEVTASFAQFPGSTFTVENDRHGRAVADLVLGTSYAITPAVTFSANAIAGVAKGTNHTAVDARVTWKF